MADRPVRPRTSRLPWWFYLAASIAVLSLAAIVVGYYRVPWGRGFSHSDAGPVTAWIGNTFTGVGILGLIYQLSQLRASRADETTKEINSLYTKLSSQGWMRGKEIEGFLIYVYIQNNGNRKVMNVNVDITTVRGTQIPDAWFIEKLQSFALPPDMDTPLRAALFHVPADAGSEFSENLGNLKVKVSWIDPWMRQVQMINNMPSMVVEE